MLRSVGAAAVVEVNVIGWLAVPSAISVPLLAMPMP